jgi:intein-encoded DNA endonuclease-like protein
LNKLNDNNVIIRSSGESRIIILPINTIIKKYNEGINISEISKEYDCSYDTIRNRLEDNNVIMRSRSESNSIDLPINIIIKKYNNGSTTIELGNIYDCSPGTIVNKLKEHNIELRSVSKSHTIKLPINIIIEEYKNGMSTYKLGKKYNCNPHTIRNRLIAFNIKLRSLSDASNISYICVCKECGNEFLGKSTAIYCNECNPQLYCYKFDNNCKEQNREKYGRECFFCGKTEMTNGKKLSVHHADYNKNQGCDNTPDWKLVPLCKKCHGLTGGNIKNRKIWESRILYLHGEYWSLH